ncbi:unnamed protein product [Symbiodinium natans]|uniref:Transmembrane protein n=1 Tax=Symbiodinium natans TaxID=878477 RepID=A0A812V4R2_9DINO|nr:unnamed protein product [Symbiodinium natans]
MTGTAAASGTAGSVDPELWSVGQESVLGKQTPQIIISSPPAEWTSENGEQASSVGNSWFAPLRSTASEASRSARMPSKSSTARFAEAPVSEGSLVVESFLGSEVRTVDTEISKQTLTTRLEANLLRGVHLEASLRGFGRSFAHGASQSAQTSEKFSEESFMVEALDVFLSHDWRTSRWLKFMSLLIIFNLRAATVVTVIATILLGFLLGRFGGEQVELESWYYVIPYVMFCVVLCFWQRVRKIFRATTIFLDKLCISQQDPELRAAGIKGLAAFLDASTSLVVLWSPRYFTRLWCAYELAAYARHPERLKPMQLMPVAVSLLLLLIFLSGSTALTAYEIVQNILLRSPTNNNGANGGMFRPNIFALSLAINSGLLASFLPAACYFGAQMMTHIQSLEQQLSEFSIENAECFCCSNDHVNPETGEVLACDRAMIYETLRTWYGERFSETFNTIVRTKVSKLVLGRAGRMVVPLEYKLYLALVTSTPGLLDAVIAITSRDHGDDTADRVWAVIQLMLAQWVGQFNVMLFMMWLLFRICKVCVWLQKRMPLRCAVALLSPAMVLLTSCFYFVQVFVSSWARHNAGSDVPLRELIRAGFFILSLLLVKLCD